MKLRCTLPLVLVVLAALGCGSAEESTIPDGAVAHASTGKQPCRTVVKRVDGRKRRVRVCGPAKKATSSPVLARIALGAEAWIVTAGADGSVWADGPNGVVRIDPRTNRISVRTSFAGTAAGGAGSIWVPSGTTLRRLDPSTGAVQATIALPHAGEWALALDDAVWVTGPDERALMRVDPATNTVVATVPACDVKGYGLAAAEGAIWAACYLQGELLRIDTATNQVTARVALAYGVHSVAAGAGSIWVNNHDNGVLSRVDVDSRRVVATLRTGANPAIAFVDGALWAAGDDALLKISPQTNRIVGRLPVGTGEFYSVAYASGSFWLSTIFDGRVLRLDPARLRRP